MPQVNSNVPYFTLKTSHQLHLSMRWLLVMQSSYGTPYHGAREIDLGDCLAPARGSQIDLAKQPLERTATIADPFATDLMQTSER